MYAISLEYGGVVMYGVEFRSLVRELRFGECRERLGWLTDM
jgi:hypothetical protein